MAEALPVRRPAAQTAGSVVGARSAARTGGEGMIGIVKVRKETTTMRSTSISGKRATVGDLSVPMIGQESKKLSNMEGLKGILLDPVCLLLVFWPLGCLAHFLEWGDVCGFWFNFLAMVPLAKLLGDATEELATGLQNETVGGLLNATFGNAVEMILTISSLRAAKQDLTMLDVTKGTLLGSILSNLLLVLGCAFLFGGLTPVAPKKTQGSIEGPEEELTCRGKVQCFNTEAALTNMTMLFLAAASFAFPTVFVASHGGADDDLSVKVSRWCSIYIVCSYVCFLGFQLYTHIDMFKGDEDGEEEEEETAAITPAVAMGMLFTVTLFVAASSEWLVDSIDGLVDKLKGTPFEMSHTFIGIILLPIVGNACEHLGAVRMAMVEKVDISIGIAVGSSTQIALFVVPFSVLAGWLMGVPMDLNFGSLNSTVMVFAVLIAFSVLTDGNANWLEGVMLVVAYLVVATLYLFFPDTGAA